LSAAPPLFFGGEPPGVEVHAIMDDISLVGSLPELAIAVPTIIAELRKIGRIEFV
jgi:hypothetical protein